MNQAEIWVVTGAVAIAFAMTGWLVGRYQGDKASQRLDQAVQALRDAVEERGSKGLLVRTKGMRLTPVQYARIYLADVITAAPLRLPVLEVGDLTPREQKAVIFAFNKQKRRLIRTLGADRVLRRLGV